MLFRSATFIHQSENIIAQRIRGREVKLPSSKLTIVLVGLIISLFIPPVVALSAPKPGSTCTKAGSTQSYLGIKYTCIKSGKKLVWNGGVSEKKATNQPTPAPSTSPSTASNGSNLKTYTAQMPKAYLPKALSSGWDDYRCFLLDPKVDQDSIIRSIQFIPERKEFVHHAIIFRVTNSDIPEAQEKSKSGTGWSCFGGAGLEIGRAHV